MFDMGMGSFAEASSAMADLMAKNKLNGRVFSVGEEVQVKASKFTIEQITQHELILRLIPDVNHQQIPQ